MSLNTSADNASNSKRGGGHTSNNLERYETFECSGPTLAFVTTSSGDVTIGASESSAIEVTLSIKDVSHRDVFDDATIEFDKKKNSLVVRSRSHENVNSLRGFKAVIKRGSWFEFGSSDPDVHIALPEGSSVEVTTASGNTNLIGNLDRASVTSASGGVRVADEVGSLEMKTASGDVSTASVVRSLICHSASGDVRCGGAGATTKIRTASGSVKLVVDNPSDISVRTVSGSVSVSVARGLEVDVDATTISGRLSSTMPLDSSKGGPSNGDVVSISAKTVSGSVSISSAN
jgi:DUF4097 and DUF4098 domain-containing protein YvlB